MWNDAKKILLTPKIYINIYISVNCKCQQECPFSFNSLVWQVSFSAYLLVKRSDLLYDLFMNFFVDCSETAVVTDDAIIQRVVYFFNWVGDKPAE